MPIYRKHIHTFSLFVPISTRTRVPESDAVTFFAVLPVSWLPMLYITVGKVKYASQFEPQKLTSMPL